MPDIPAKHNPFLSAQLSVELRVWELIQLQTSNQKKIPFFLFFCLFGWFVCLFHVNIIVTIVGVMPKNLFCLAVKAAIKQVYKKKASVGDAATEYLFFSASFSSEDLLI